MKLRSLRAEKTHGLPHQRPGGELTKMKKRKKLEDKDSEDKLKV